MVGLAPKLFLAELITLAVIEALLGFTSEARSLRHVSKHLAHLFPTSPTSRATTNAGDRLPPNRGF